jgi:hypothetical protein
MLAFRKAAAIPKLFAAGLLAVALTATGLSAWTGYLGGQIRHPEIRSGAPVSKAALVERWMDSRRDDD